MKLSIIVPVYNVATYLRKCVDSLLAQDISDYEIILVDDGSTDGSAEIAEAILASPKLFCSMNVRSGHSIGQEPFTPEGKDLSSTDILPFFQGGVGGRLPIISVIHQENKGLSEARNTGTRAARGEYIMYVDSDDYLQPNVLGALMEQVERDELDVLRFRYQNVKESGEAFAPYKDMTNYNDYSASPIDGLTFLNERMGNQCYAVMFVVRRGLALQELFTPGIYFEDTDWTPRMLLQAKRVASTELVVYNYLWREGSITLSQKDIQKQRKQLEDKINLLEKLNTWGKQVADRRWFDGMISGLVINIVGMIAATFYAERKQYIQRIKSIGILPIKSFHIAPRAQRKVKLINISINLAVLVLRIIHTL